MAQTVEELLEGAVRGSYDFVEGMEIAGMEIAGYDLAGAPLVRLPTPQPRATGATASAALQKVASAAAATQQQQRAALLAQQQVNAMRAAANRPTVVDNPPTKLRKQPIGLTADVAVPANSTVTLTAQPQVLFKPIRYIVDVTASPNFLINDIRVGKNSQFVAAGAQPASAYSPGALGADIEFDTCPVSGVLSVTITNTTGGALDFSSMFIGMAAE